MILSFEKVFGTGHLCFLVASVLLMILGIILIKKLKPSEKTIDTIVNISALVLLISILVNRFSVTYYDVIINHREGYTWFNVIPNSYCGISSLVLSLAVLFGKKNNKVLHFITYFGFIGGLVTMLYPDFLDTQSFFEIRSITGLLHHTIMVWVVILLISVRYVIPEMKKWKIYPIGFAFVMLFGVFLKDCFHFTKAMQIGEPLLKSLPVLTSWYVLAVVDAILYFTFIYLYDHFVNHKTNQEIWEDFKK